ncbi:MAG: hypothetical protein LBU18_04325 [Treponema sp.]|jgi:hypothetical protein|nr:hypothetical protein [Treponema sp.]
MPGVTYDVLLLAGYGDVLLAAGYALNNTIEKGVKNTIVITMKSITPQWDIPSGGNNAIGDKNDFTFTAAGLDADTGSANGGVPGKETELTVNPVSRSISISPTTGAKQGLPRIISDSSFTVTFNLSRLSPLILASKKESGSYVLKFASQRVAIEGPGAAALAPQYNDVLFSIGNAAGAAHASGAYTVTSSLTEEAIKAAGGVKAVYTVSGSVQDGTGAAVQTGGAGLLGVF